MFVNLEEWLALEWRKLNKETPKAEKEENLFPLIHIDIPFLVIIVRNRPFSSNALKSEELPTHLKADPSLKRISQHIFLNKNQSPKLTLIILKQKLLPLKIINQIGMMPRYRYIFRQLDINIFLPTNTQFTCFWHWDKMIDFWIFLTFLQNL